MKHIHFLTSIFFIAFACNVFSQFTAKDADDNAIYETRSIFKIPQDIRRYCEIGSKPLDKLFFRILETDLNGDGTPEFILDPQNVSKDQTYVNEEERSWLVLFKSFENTYICIGTISRPVFIQKHDNGWSDIVCRNNRRPDPEEDVPPFILYDFFMDNYSLAAELEHPEEELTPEKAYSMLNEIKSSRFQTQPEDRRKLLSTLNELAESVEIIKKTIDNMPSELKADMLQAMIQPVKDLESSLLRSLYAAEIAERLLELKDYEAAADMFDIALEACLQNNPDEPEEYAELLCRQAVAYSNSTQNSQTLSKWTDALKYYQMAAEKKPEYQQHVATTLANIAIFHHNKNNIADFRQNARESLDLFEKLSSDDLSQESAIAFATISGLWANVSESDSETAEKYYTQSLSLFQQIEDFMEKLGDVANAASTLANAAKFHRKNGDAVRAANEMNGALKLFLFCYHKDSDFLQEVFSTGEDLVILLNEARDEESANNLLAQLEDLPTAENHFYSGTNFSFLNQFANTCIQFHNPKQALDIIEKCFKSASSMSAQTRTMLILTKARALYELKQYETAIELLQNHLDGKPAPNINLPSVYYNLGRAYSAMGDHGKAEKNLLDALALCKEYEASSSIVARCLCKLADIHAARQNATAAEKEYGEALELFEKADKKDIQYSVDYLSCLNNMSVFLHDSGRAKEAIALQKKAVAQLEDIPENFLPLLFLKAEILRNSGNFCSDLKQHEEAEKYYKEALDVCESAISTEGEKDLETMTCQANTYFNRGNLYDSLDMFEQAEKDFRKSAKLFHKLGEDNHLPKFFLSESKSLNNLANLLSKQKRHDEAEKVFTTVIKLRDENAKNDSDRKELAKAIFNFAWHLTQKDEGEKAFFMFEKGLKISRELGNDVLTARFLTFCAITSDNDEVGKKHYAEACQLVEKHPEDPEAVNVRTILNSIKQHFTDDAK